MKNKSKKVKKSKAKPKVIEIPKLFPERDYAVKIIKPKAPDNSHFLNEIKEKIDQYNNEVVNNILKEYPIQYQNFKKNFFGNLEILYQQTIIIEDENLKAIRIKHVWDWYQERLKFFTDINNINRRTQSSEWERHPNLDNLDTKSDYYKAFNYPVKFEFDFRTEHEGLLPPKDRLKGFVTKHISNQESKERLENYKKELNARNMGERITSATSTILRNTNYTSNTTGTKFFRSTLNSTFREAKSETKQIKSNYSHLNPDYNLSNLNVENTFLLHKNRELSQKRHQEEVKEYLQEWGRKKAFFKQDQQKNTEIRNLISYYEDIHKMDENKEELNSINKDFVIEKKNKDNSDYSNSLYIQNIEDDKIIDKDYQVPKYLEKISLKEANNSCINLINENSNILIDTEKFPIKISLNIKGPEDKFIAAENNKLNNEKVDTTSYSILRQLNPIFETRINYSQAANLKEIDNQITNYTKYYQPLSNYDYSNLNNTCINFSRKTKSSELQEIDANNYYLKKCLMIDHNNDLIAQFRSHQSKKNNHANKSSIKCLKQPKMDTIYNKFYLPNVLDETISRPSEKRIKKSKNKKK